MLADGIENIYIYVSDSLRWDYLPDAVSAMGVGFKTVAQSCYSAPSFSTLSTGRCVPRHGVSRWYDQVPESLDMIYDISGTDGGFYQPGDVETQAMFSVLRRDSAIPVSEMSSPFVALERDEQPHLPFTGTDAESVEEYFNERGDDWDRIRAEYRDGIEASVERFQQRLDALESAGELDSTLVIFTSDHGELFGEYGEAAHSAPAVPELVYVPTVFIAPSLSASDFTADPDEDVIEHVDVIETAMETAGHDFETDGTDLSTSRRERDWGYNHVKTTARGKEFYTAEGIWWRDSGHVFHTNSRLLRALAVLYRFTKGSERQAIRWNVGGLLNAYLPSEKTFGSPPLSRSQARSVLEEFIEELGSESAESGNLSEQAESRLEELGYLDR